MGSKQANEINKESKADSTGMVKEGQDPFSCVKSRKRVIKKRRKSTKRKNGERELSASPETAKREASNRNDASEPEKSTTFLRSYSGRFISQRATNSEPRGSAVILGPSPHFLPREIPLRSKGNFTYGGFSFEGQGKGKLKKKLMEERPALMRKRRK